MNILDILYPPCCPICDCLSATGICPSCMDSLTFIDDDFCLKCGKPLEDSQEEFCQACKKHSHKFDEARSLLLYDDMVKMAIYKLKYSYRRDIGSELGIVAARRLGKWISRRRVTRIVPVPLHPARRRARGYNQAAVIARAIGHELDIYVDDKLIIRTKDTKALKKLDSAQRKKTMRNAFSLAPEADIPGSDESILIVDDVYTSGSTADEAVSCLRNGGANCRFYVLCLATGY